MAIRYQKEAYEKVYGLIERMERPVSLEGLDWEVTYGEGADEFKLLATNPRRTGLLTIIGDLMDVQALSVRGEGLDFSEPPVPVEVAVGRIASNHLLAS